jgi:hypothetical protein
MTGKVHGAVHSVRMDRMFLAGPAPMTEGTDHLWIVDFKSSTHGAEDLDKFLAQQKEEYLGQMQTYAAVAMAAFPQYAQVHLGLYFPLLQRFVHWQNAPAPGPERGLRSEGNSATADAVA